MTPRLLLIFTLCLTGNALAQSSAEQSDANGETPVNEVPATKTETTVEEAKTATPADAETVNGDEAQASPPTEVKRTPANEARPEMAPATTAIQAPVVQSEKQPNPGAKTGKTKKKSPFKFGSYGRVIASTDQDGGRGEASQITPFGPRLTESSYMELDFSWRPEKQKEGQVQTTVTIAYGDRFMHYDGRWESEVAIRQAFVEVQDLNGSVAFIWVGSRMFRGDDIYLLNFWPMDDLNTIGGAFGWKDKDTEFHFHIGGNRLDDALQFQRVPVPSPTFGSADATLLDRQRFIAAAKLEQRFGGTGDALGFKIRLYSEVHFLPEGKRYLSDSFTDFEPLPNDDGTLLGLQLGMWNFARRGHLNVWLRYATGLAAYDELQVPYGLSMDRRSRDAREFRAALSGNYESGIFGLMYGGYVRHFKDADGQEVDFDDRIEGAFSIRPMLIMGIFTPALEFSYQASHANGINPRTERQEQAEIIQLGFIPAITLSKAEKGEPRGTYSRPQIRAIAAVSLLNQAAMDRYPLDDPRSQVSKAWFVGMGAEWWFGRGGKY